MSDWRNLQTYCNGCGQWHDTHHMSKEEARSRGIAGGCTAGGGKKLINIENLQVYCTACKEYFRAEDGVFYCTCGHVQKREYQDSVVVVQAGDQILGYDGNVAYVLTRAGTLITANRQFINIRGA